MMEVLCVFWVSGVRSFCRIRGFVLDLCLDSSVCGLRVYGTLPSFDTFFENSSCGLCGKSMALNFMLVREGMSCCSLELWDCSDWSLWVDETFVI